ncbi:MAG TPA: hypothetical protein VGF48_01530 [Thermoanaerobaculia bacterium]|jgi:hypothetical protein
MRLFRLFILITLVAPLVAQTRPPIEQAAPPILVPALEDGLVVPLCRGNVVQNPGFTDGIVIPPGSAGSLPPAQVANWTRAYGTPQVANLPGCRDNGYIAMWGNQAVGEAIQQPVNFVAGTTYVIELCARFQAGPVNFANVELRASTAPLTSPACNTANCEVIGRTPNLTTTAWGTHQFCWTPTKNYSHLTISTTNNININDGNKVSWSNVDNICIRPSTARISGPETTCVLPATYCATPAVAGATYNWTVGGGALFTDLGNGCIVVTSNSGGMWNGGQVDVTVTPPAGGGCPTKSSLTVKPCPEKACCGDVLGAKPLSITPLAGSAGWNVTAGPFSSPPGTKVKATVVSATRTVSPASCGVGGAFVTSVSNPVSAGGWTGSVPIPNGNSVIWTATAPTALPPLTFTINSPAPGAGCSESDTVCVEYTVTYPGPTAGRCLTCSITRCFTVSRKK